MLEAPIRAARIGFVGLGTMGLPMAENAIDAGFDIVGFDLREEPMDDLAGAGGEPAADLGALAAECPVVSVMVETAAQVEEVVAGEDGVFDGLAEEGGLVLVHSTVHPETPETLAAAAPDGVTLLDAPVTGSPPRARTGELAFLVGGPEAVVDDFRPYFDAMGTSVHPMGPVGAGEAAKLSNNLVAISNIMTTAEGLRLGTEWGLDEDALREVMAAGSGDSFVLEHWDFFSDEWEAVQPGGFDGAAEICAKDLSIALSLARTLELEIPGAAVASQRAPAFLRACGDAE